MAIVFAACTDKVVTPPFLKIAAPDTEIGFGPAADNVALDVETNSKIAAVSDHPDWCVVAVSEGEATQLNISVSANPDEADRSAIVTVSAVGTQLTPVEIKVTQSFIGRITIPQEYLTLSFPGNAGGLRNIPVQTSGNKPITASSTQDWCKVSVSGFMVNVSASMQTPGAPERTAEITIAAEGMESLLIPVAQTAFAGYVNIVDASHLAHHLKGETNTSVYVSINNNVPFVAESNQAWCTITQFDNETRHQIKIAAPKNETGVVRTAQITVTGGVEPIVITLTQDAANHETGFPRFAVLSDTHFDNNEGAGESSAVKVPRAVTNLAHKSNLDAVFVVGDITDHGNEGEYVNLVACFTNPAIVPANLPVYYLLGNHDQSGSGLTGEYFFLKYLHQSMNQYLEIKGYPFILISQTNSTVWDFNHAAQRFLTESLVDAAATYPGKPIFVFVHVPPRNTCYGSSESDGWGSPIWPPLLEGYPQVIVFAGHSHFPVGDPRSIWQDKYTSVNDGSTNFSELEPGLISTSGGGIHPKDIDLLTKLYDNTYNKVTEGLIVTSSASDVVIERWDTRRNEEILPQWTVHAPFDGSNFASEYKGRSGLPKPAFPAGSADQITVEKSGDKLYVVFPQAVDNEVVHHYNISIKNGGVEVAKQTIFSHFYLNSDTPALLPAEFTGLPAGSLSVEIIAVDSYYISPYINESDPIVKVFTN
jgi:Icc-related predicted phosphoesterase